jgi:hypothetical protein
MSFPRTPLPHCMVFFLAAASMTADAATVDVYPGNNNLAISRVVYDLNGNELIQTSEASGVNDVGSSSVLLKSITAGGTEFTFFNLAKAKVVNINPVLGITSGVGVADNASVIASNAGLTAYGNAVAATSMDTDLRNYGFHDFMAPGPTPVGVADLDLLFDKALNPGDSLVVSERWGNSVFQLMALGANGDPYVGANIVRLGGSGDPSTGYQAHDWNTGFASTVNQSSQAQALTLFSIGKFFEGTALTPSAIYGFRIFNYDEADVKILGISDNTFTNNPDNPLVPEPSVLLFAFSGGLALVFARKRG